MSESGEILITAAGQGSALQERQPDEDAELIRRCQAGDEWAFEALVKKYQRLVFSLIYHLTGRVHETEDIAQKVFARVYFSLDKFRLDRAFYPWLYRITINQCYDALRQWKRQRTLTFSELPIEASADVEGLTQGSVPHTDASDREHLHALVQKVLARLPKAYRTVLTLKDIEGLSYKEIASLMGCSLQAARLRVSRARMRMRKALERALKK